MAIAIKIPDLTAQQAKLGAYSVGQLSIGPVQIGQLVIDNMAMRMSAGVVQLRNFRITLTIELSLDWRIHVGLPWPLDDINEGDTIQLGNPSFSLPLGDVTIPGLQNLNFTLNNLAASNMSATMSPLANLRLGPSVASQIRARNTVAPVAGFTVAGLGITSLQGTGVSLPAAALGEVTIGQFKMPPVPIGQVALNNLNLGNATVNEVQSQQLDVNAVSNTRRFHADLGILEFTLNVRPRARSQIERLRIANATAQASIGSLSLRNVVAPIEMLNLTLGDLGIETVTIPQFGVA